MKTKLFLLVAVVTALVISGCSIMSVLPPPSIGVRVEENISDRFSGSSITVRNTSGLKLLGMVGDRVLGVAPDGGGWLVGYPFANLSYYGFSKDFAVQTTEPPFIGASQNFSVNSYSQEEIWFVKRDTSSNRLYFSKQ